MASEYTLQLKATLDTAEVQQKLQQLRNQQNRQLSQENASKDVLGNLGNLNQFKTTISKLETALYSLQKSIEKLVNRNVAQTTNKQQQQITSQSSQQKRTQVVVPQNSVRPTNIPIVQTSRDKFFNKLMRNAGLTDIEAQVLRYRYGIQPPAPSNDNLTLNKLIQNRKFASIIGGQLLGGAGSLANDFGYKRTGAVFNALGTGFSAGGSAAYTSQLFGMSDKGAGRLGIGIGIVAAAASLTKAFFDLKDAAENVAKAQNDIVKKQSEQGFTLQGARSQFFDALLAKDVLKVQNTDIANARREYSRSVAEWQKNKLEGMEDPAAFARRIREQAQNVKSRYGENKSGFDTFSDMMSTAGYALNLGALKDTEHAIDEAANQVIDTYYKQFEAALKEAQAAEATANMWQSVVDNLKEAHQKSEESIRRMRIEDAQKKNAAFKDAQMQAEEFRWADQMRATQIFANSTLRTDINRMTPQAQFKAIADELDKLRENRNSRLREAYDLNRQILSRPQGINGNAYQDLVKRRDLALREAQNFESRGSVLEHALSQIQNIIASPDLSHMTSLAQYGFNMGEKDDTVQVMEKYYSKMTNLTKQIKDKLDQGITTTATYD